MTEERFKEIEDKLVSYLGENPPHPNMRVFCGLNHLDHNEVKEVLMKSTRITLPQITREQIAKTFVKVVLPKTQPVRIESWKSINKKRKKDLRQKFHAFDGTAQEFCKKYDITLNYLRTIADPDDWKNKYAYKEGIDWDALMDAFEYCTQSVQEFCEENGLDIATFRTHCPPELWKERYAYVRNPENQTNWQALVEVLETMPDKSIQDFCTEQGIDQNLFRLHCPKEVWKRHYKYARLMVENWDAKIEEMKASGLSHQEWCNRQGISAVVFKAHCPPEILAEYDKTNMEDRKRAEAFRPDLSIKENAKLMGLTPQNMYVWTTSKLQKLAPEKWERMQQLKADAKLDDKDRKIIELEKRISSLEQSIADLNERNAKLTSKNDQLQSGLTSLKVQLGNEKRKNQDLARKIKAFADTLLAE